jgi:O-antigen ligase
MAVPFAIVTLGNGDTSVKLGWVLGLAAGATLVFSGFVLGRLQRPPAVARYWVLLVIWASLTAFWALDREVALKLVITAGSLIAVYLIAISVRLDDKQFSRVCMMCLVGGCAAAGIAIQRALAEGIQQRLMGITGTAHDDPNMFAASLLLPLSLAVSMAVTNGRLLRRAVTLCAAGVITLGILVTMSRGGLLSLVAMIIVFAYRLRFRRRMIFVVTVVALLLSFMPGVLFQRVQATKHGDARLTFWRLGLMEILPRHGLIGVGLGNFPVAFTRYGGHATGILPEGEEFNRDSHNIYVGTAVELGLPGFVLLVTAIVGQRKQLQRFYARSRSRPGHELVGFEAAMWALLVAGFFINLFWHKFFWLNWMLLAQAVVILERRLAESPQQGSAGKW